MLWRNTFLCKCSPALISRGSIVPSWALTIKERLVEEGVFDFDDARKKSECGPNPTLNELEEALLFDVTRVEAQLHVSASLLAIFT